VLFRSILSRIVLLHALALIGTAVMLPMAVYWFLSAEVRALQDQAFVEQADALAQRLEIDKSGTWRLALTPALEAQYSSAYGRYSYAVLDPSGRVLFASREDAQPVFPDAPRTPSPEILEIQTRDHDMAGVSVHKQLGGRDVWVQVGEDLTHRDVIVDDVVAGFLRNVAPVTAGILLLLLLADLYIFRRAIRPIVFAAEQVSRITPGRIDVRLSGEKLPGELQPLVAGVNQALDRLEQGFVRQRHFTETVAHELRTPLTILRGEADVALRGKQDAALQRQSLERIQGQAAELSHLLEDLLEFARSAAEDQPYEMADLQLDEVVASAVQEAQTLAAPREVTLRLQLGDQRRHLEADFRRLKQAMLIGLDNAIKHSPPGTTVTIATAIEGPHAKVSILDEGSGIDEADLPRVFERFYRGRDEDDTLMSGLGIGLAIAKDIVERHGGSISLSNQPEGGAALAILLPVEHHTS